MEIKIDPISADAGIRQLHARCTDAVWRKDAHAFADCFTAAGEWHIATMQLRGREMIRTTFESVMTSFDRVLMTFRSPALEVADRHIVGRTYVTELSRFADGRTVNSVGIYYERFVHESGAWRFAWRHFQLHYMGPPDLSGAWFDNPEYGAPPGAPGTDEPTLDHAGMGAS